MRLTSTPLSATRTQVDFEHRDLEKFGDAAERLQGAMGEGWAGILASFGGSATAET